MLQSSIFRGLLDQLAAEDDPAKRAELVHKAEHQYDLDMEHQANFVQNRIGALELDIREQVATSLGSTNQMISDLVADSRTDRSERAKYLAANTAALEGLRKETQTGFRTTHERIDTLGERVTNNEARIDAVEAGLEESRRDRIDLRQQNTTAQHERKRIEDKVDALTLQINDVLSLVGAMDFGFIEAFPDAVLVVDRSGVIIQVNGRAELLFGYHRADLIGQAIELLIPEDLRSAHVAQRSAYAENPHPRRMGHERPGGVRAFPALRSDGGQLMVEVGLGPFTLNGKPCIIATVREAGHASQ